MNINKLCYRNRSVVVKKVGILGGTFDPPHYGHLLIADDVRTELQLDEIWFMPNYIPPHKDKQVTDHVHRVHMLRVAIANQPHFRVETIELERKERSYTYDTIVLLKQRYPDTMFYFIIGGDMVEYLPNWYRIDELVQLVQFVGVKRPGYSLRTPYPIIEVDVPTFAVSSSLIRERIQSGKSVTYLLPEAVQLYIKENRLYET
ncbi:Nicotinic acid mononucleotide adenylyltransferase [Anoxybacillus flavithermus WK1]|uniref:Probable nicotinate-nucleotide adenylyltransferase n=1 Tax=Anoxybacillus flavithermus (strain DSM 21510 / WK1) TaxID=491915 RepID=B7GKA8_ANOFW|nr:Nicotinic acid mononucleotide adenylyltransferase [Anoxybacillus flavithermus WK1]